MKTISDKCDELIESITAGLPIEDPVRDSMLFIFLCGAVAIDELVHDAHSGDEIQSIVESVYRLLDEVVARKEPLHYPRMMLQ